MDSASAWRLEGATLRGGDNEQYQVYPHEFWYVAPNRISYAREDGKVRPLEFAFALHNASNGEGLLISHTSYTGGAPARPRKGGAAGEAEDLLESIRKETYPNKPSRYNAYFLNFSKDVAEMRSRDALRGKNEIVRCLLVMNGAKVHFADMELYERLEGRPDDRELAASYWKDFEPRNDAERLRLEVVCESALYFPDWASFQKIPSEDLVLWSKIHLNRE